MNRRTLLPFLFAAMLAMPVIVKAQDATPPAGGGGQGQSDQGRGNRGDRGNRGNGFMTMLKERMGNPSDDEWKVIEPKLQKVMDVRRESMPRFGGFGRGGDRGGDRNSSGDDQKQSAVQQAQSDLQKTLDNKSATEDEIKAKITALRDAREKAKTQLAAAQKDLKDVLSQRQEAALVMMGMLD